MQEEMVSLITDLYNYLKKSDYYKTFLDFEIEQLRYVLVVLKDDGLSDDEIINLLTLLNFIFVVLYDNAIEPDSSIVNSIRDISYNIRFFYQLPIPD